MFTKVIRDNMEIPKWKWWGWIMFGMAAWGVGFWLIALLALFVGESC